MILTTSERIKELREKNGYTQSSLAKRLSITRACVNAWEMGISAPSTENLAELSQIFHVSSDYILGLNSDESVSIVHLKHEEKEIIYRLLNYFDGIHKFPSESSK